MKYPYESCIGSRVRSISRKVDSIYRKHLAGSGITENQLSISMALFKTGKVEQKVIGNILNLEKSSLSRNLIRLIDLGYVVKSGAINRPVIELTEKGRRMVKELTPNWENAMDELRNVLSEDDLIGFASFESKLMNL